MLDLVYLEIVLNLTQDRCTVCAKHTTGSCCKICARFVPTYHSLRNSFGRTRWNSKVTWLMWNLVLVHLEIVLVSVQDRCTVCAKHTVGSEIVLDAPDSTPS
jgi:hypothetical protein